MIFDVLWKMFFYLEKRCKRSYVAGDDDQSLYDFLGADPSIFIKLEGEKQYLKESRRVPRLVHEQASLILKNIARIFEPSYNSLDTKLWVQKLILKKYLKKNS